MKNISDKSYRETRNTHFVFCNFFFENRAFYEVMWKNTVEGSRPQMTIWCMCIACWIPKATKANTSCVIIIVSPLWQWLRASMLHYTCIACLFRLCDGLFTQLVSLYSLWGMSFGVFTAVLRWQYSGM